jgi:hypothetical protein
VTDICEETFLKLRASSWLLASHEALLHGHNAMCLIYTICMSPVSLPLHHLYAVICYALKSVLGVIQILKGMNMFHFRISFCRNQIIFNHVEDNFLHSSPKFPDDKLRDIQPNNYHAYYLYLINRKLKITEHYTKNILLFIHNIQLSDEHLTISALTSRVKLNTDDYVN